MNKDPILLSTGEVLRETPDVDIQEKLMKLCGAFTVTVWKGKYFSVTGILSYVGEDIWKVKTPDLFAASWTTFHIVDVHKIMVNSIELK